jgi:ribosomal protein S18 acetylase RimI-like enzyme
MRDGRAGPSAAGAIRLRPMTGDDIPDSVPLLAQLGYELTVDEAARRVREVLSTPDHEVVVAESAGRVVGLIHVFVRPAIENPREAVVEAIVVDEAFRRAGVGRILMAQAERWGSERNCRSVVLSSNVARTPAHAFYAALGYQVAATAYVLRKPLSPAPLSFVAGPSQAKLGQNEEGTSDPYV